MTAFGALGLKPDEFWNLTPVELNRLAIGYNKEEARQLDLQQRLLAWHASNIMNVHVKKKIKPEDLYKPKSRSSNKITRDNRRTHLNQLLKKLGKKTLPTTE